MAWLAGAPDALYQRLLSSANSHFPYSAEYSLVSQRSPATFLLISISCWQEVRPRTRGYPQLLVIAARGTPSVSNAPAGTRIRPIWSSSGHQLVSPPLCTRGSFFSKPRACLLPCGDTPGGMHASFFAPAPARAETPPNEALVAPVVRVDPRIHQNTISEPENAYSRSISGGTDVGVHLIKRRNKLDCGDD